MLLNILKHTTHNRVIWSKMLLVPRLKSKLDTWYTVRINKVSCYHEIYTCHLERSAMCREIISCLKFWSYSGGHNTLSFIFFKLKDYLLDFNPYADFIIYFSGPYGIGKNIAENDRIREQVTKDSHCLPLRLLNN